MPLNPLPKNVPQADTLKIAKQLFSDAPDVVDKFGDAMGVRPTTAADIARDFTLGAQTGDASKVAKLKDDARKEYEGRLYKAQQQAVAQQTADREKTMAGWKMITEAVHIDPKYRKQILKEQLGELGITASNGALAMWTDEATHAALPMKEIDAKINSGEFGFGDLQMAAGTASGAVDLYKALTDKKLKDAQTANAVADYTKKTTAQADFDSAQNYREQHRQAVLRRDALVEKKDKIGLKQAQYNLDNPTSGRSGGSANPVVQQMFKAAGLGPRQSSTPAAPAKIGMPQAGPVVDGATPADLSAPVGNIKSIAPLQ